MNGTGQEANRARRVWLVNLFFGMGPAPTGVLLESAAVALQRRGLDVEVLAGRAAYNDKARAAAAGHERFTGRVHRLWSGPVGATGVAGRLASWLCYYGAVAWFAFTRPLPGRVLVLTTPPLLHALFVLRNLFARRKAELVLWNQDTYPDVLAAVGLLRRPSLVYAALEAVQCWATRRAHRAIALDRAMEAILRRQGAREVVIVPNWEVEAEAGAVDESGPLFGMLKEIKASYRYLVLYTGNYGWGHDLTILFDHLRRRPEQRDFFFLFVGGGEKWPALTDLQGRDRLPCVRVLPYVPKATAQALIRRADFGLAALDDSCVGLMSPSKVHGYLACGKPLLYVGAARSNVDDAIEEFACGFRVAPHDAAGLEACLARIARADFDYDRLSRNALTAFRSRYCEEVGSEEVADVVAGPARVAGLVTGERGA